ncbi:glycosyltransferase family 2 protein [Candidatus Microgenomates bacterium]|nr:glycosyltransferase family 2 protein [Candidatus Microgenomates bacterium]
MKLSIIIPVFNEAKTITKILKKVLELDLEGWQKEIIIINDSSTDQTKKVINRFTKKGVKVVSHQQNLGKGAAIRTGLAKATGDFVIIQDADLEYNPNDIRSLLVTAENNPGFVIYGSRFRGRHEDTVFGHKAGNALLTLLTNLLYGSSLSDMETCYKLIPVTHLHRLKLESNRFNFEPEVTAKLLRLGIGILEVPINYKKRGYSEGKKIKWHDGVSAALTLLKYRWL